jgi:hypothetical protein
VNPHRGIGPHNSAPPAESQSQRISPVKRPATSVGLSTPAPEYRRSDFGTLVRGKYVARLQASSNVVILDPEVAELFPNAAAVNAALRSLAEIAKRADSLRSRSQ